MAIFQKSVIKKHLNNLDKEQVEKAFLKFRENYTPAKIEHIKKLKEEEYQDGFLREIFVDVLGYTLRPSENFDLQREFKNQTDGKKADGAILRNENAIAVIELKSAKTKDLTLVTQQAFNYKNNQPECKYIITSNFQKLRFYIDYSNEHEEFDLFHLNKEEFELLFLILSKESIFSNLPIKLKEETQFHDQNISAKLYKDYSNFKRKLYDNLTFNHPEIDKLTLFKKSQKLLDRFLFILFAEDSGLLPPNSISRIIKRFEILKEEDSYKPLYEIFKQYFGYMNVGRKGKKQEDDIPAYNGGLFYEDELLDILSIDDELLILELRNLSEYDFNTEVDVNILGHIFEHSLNEIEEFSAEIQGTITDNSRSKRKKDGVFYTPKYITQYIVENTIGTLCNEKRKELQIEEIEFDGTYQSKTGKLSEKGKNLFQKLNNYKDWLINLKIIDPACGSGAFLNQALSFLIAEHTTIDDIIAELTNSPLRLFDVDKNILENNLFGVDINEESVEIAQLSLWLRTARKDRKLSSLNNNIKCGNSLINDPTIAGDKAFDWNVEFKEIMDNGGFDVVIGNPPYVLCQPSNTEEKTLEYYKTSRVASYKIDLFHLFFEKAINLLSKNGRLGFITPNTYLTNKYIEPLRNFIISNTSIKIIVNHKEVVFAEASVDVATIILDKHFTKDNKINIVENFNGFFKSIDTKLQSKWNEDEDKIFNVNKEFNIDITDCLKLDEISSVTFGLQTKDKSTYVSEFKKEDDWENCYTGKDIQRYNLNKSTLFFKNNSKIVKAGGSWDMNIHHSKKIVVRQVGNPEPIFAFDKYAFATLNTMYSIVLNNDYFEYNYLLTILNSELIKKYWLSMYSDGKQLFPKIKGYQLKSLPIKKISKEHQQPFIEKADKMLDLNQQLQEKSKRFIKRVNDNFELGKISKKLEVFYENDFKSFVSELNKQKVVLSLIQQDEWEAYFTSYKTEINQIQTEINKTDCEIDQMVYELYGLSENEIEIIENSNKW